MPWLQLIIESEAAQAETLSEWLADNGAAAVTLVDAADQPLYEPAPNTTPLWQATRVVGLYPAEANPGRLIAALHEALPWSAQLAWRAEQLEDRDWDREWMDNFKPIRVTDHLWVVPSWHEPPDTDAVNLLLDPGLAFGTGTHPTTFLCLEWLDRRRPDGELVIDYGCGSGILAVAAARLGAREVWGVDTDPQALIATGDNAERNGVAAQVRAVAPDRLAPMQADALVANILAGPLIELAPRLAALVRRGGGLALSGILPEQAEAVAAAYREHFELAPPTQLDGWVRLEGHRK